jgi:hypothetical protein
MRKRHATTRWVVPIVSGAILIGAAGLAKMIAVAQQGPAPVFIAGDQPVTEEQVRNKLMSEGWVGVRTTQEGRYIQATGSANGQSQKVVVDARNGRLRAQADDDDDDDD